VDIKVCALISLRAISQSILMPVCSQRERSPEYATMINM
jgi:hypothetical protein